MKKIFQWCFVLILTTSVFATPVRSNLGSRHVNYVQGEEGMPNPYVTDGLLAMWDGEWNVAVGIHSESTTVWKDISGNGNDFLLKPDSFVWEDNAIFGLEGRTGSNICIGYMVTRVFGTIGTIECVANPGYGHDYESYVNGEILTGPYADGIIIVRPRGYASRTICCILNQSHGAPWYSKAGYGTRAIDMTVAFSSILEGTGTSAAYLNGSQISSYGYVVNSRNFDRISLGGRYDSYFRSEYYPYYGPIYCIRIYSRQLAAEEVAWNFALDKERFDIP